MFLKLVKHLWWFKVLQCGGKDQRRIVTELDREAEGPVMELHQGTEGPVTELHQETGYPDDT